MRLKSGFFAAVLLFVVVPCAFAQGGGRRKACAPTEPSALGSADAVAKTPARADNQSSVRRRRTAARAAVAAGNRCAPRVNPPRALVSVQVTQPQASPGAVVAPAAHVARRNWAAVVAGEAMRAPGREDPGNEALPEFFSIAAASQLMPCQGNPGSFARNSMMQQSHEDSSIEFMRKHMAALDQGADPNARNARGQTRLHAMAAHAYLMGPDLAWLERLVGSELTDLNILDHEGRAPIHWAVLAGNQDAVRRLLREARCRWDLRDAQGHNVVHLAEERNDSAMLALIQDALKYRWADRPFEEIGPFLYKPVFEQVKDYLEIYQTDVYDAEDFKKKHYPGLYACFVYGVSLCKAHVERNAHAHQVRAYGALKALYALGGQLQRDEQFTSHAFFYLNLVMAMKTIMIKKQQGCSM